RPRTAEIVIQVGVDPSVALLRFQRGEVDILGDGIPPARFVQVMNDAKLKTLVVTGEQLQTGYVTINVQVKPFTDARVRRALNMAIDKTKVDQQGVAWTPEIRLPLRPFPGTIGVAPREPGLHSVIPPREVGGNMDICDLSPGARLWLPVAVPGALFSVGDTHAVQGDGGVCGTAGGIPMSGRPRFDLLRQARLRRPQFRPGRREPTADMEYHATTGIAPDLMQAARDAVRDMIDHLGRNYGLAPEMAYMLFSVAVDLHISEVVDAPNWVVSAHLPPRIFRL